MTASSIGDPRQTGRAATLQDVHRGGASTPAWDGKSRGGGGAGEWAEKERGRWRDP
jgi:hypothetical protein